jgi:osmoprotectant transport system permease protein
VRHPTAAEMVPLADRLRYMFAFRIGAAIVAGVRIATVTTIGLVTVTAVIVRGGLGELMFDRGFQLRFRTPVTVAFVLVIVMAIAADLLLLGVQRLLMPWTAKRFRVTA